VKYAVDLVVLGFLAYYVFKKLTTDPI